MSKTLKPLNNVYIYSGNKNIKNRLSNILLLTQLSQALLTLNFFYIKVEFTNLIQLKKKHSNYLQLSNYKKEH